MSSRVLRRFIVVLLLFYLGLAAVWCTIQFGHVPPYGDTGEYIRLAGSLEVDGYRGILYPAILALAGRWAGGLSFQPPALAMVGVQAFQIAMSVLCTAYLLQVMLAGRLVALGVAAAGRLALLAVLVALLTLDPLVSHFNLSIMTDGLAVSFSLAFCSALADLARRRNAPALAWAVLVASTIGMASLRVEKIWVVIGTCVLSWLAWKAQGRRAAGDRAVDVARRVLPALVCTVCLCVATQLGRSLVFQDLGRWSPLETAIHFRVIFHEMEAIYDDLPDHVRARLSREDAAWYDRRIHHTWEVIDKVTNKDPEDRAQLTRELARVAIRERWPSIGARTISAFVENLFATPSFYIRVAVWKWQGQGDRWLFDFFEGNPWVYRNLALYSPRLSAALVTLSAAVLVAASLLAALWCRSRRGRGAVALRAEVIPVDAIPFAAFLLCNNLLFALTTGGIFVRYTVFSHVLILLVMYVGALLCLLEASLRDHGRVGGAAFTGISQEGKWRRGWDSNPRSLSGHTISSRAPSTGLGHLSVWKEAD